MVISRYQKGMETQSAILAEAKKLFLEKGYKKTTLSEICRNLDIHFGTLTYYFPTKLDLLKHIYGDHLKNCYAFVREHAVGDMSILDINTAASTIYFLAIFTDPVTVRFHEQVLKNESIWAYINETTGNIYARFNGDFSLGFSADELSELEQADLGARRERCVQLLEKTDDYTFSVERIKEFSYQTNIIMARIFTIKTRLIEHSVTFTEELLKKTDVSGIKLL